MKTFIGREYTFSAAHWLPGLPEGHKCATLHGHTYKVEVVCSGELDGVGMIADFTSIDGVVQPIMDALDHTTLNNFMPLDVPTVEVISKHLFHRIDTEMSSCRLESVKVWEGNKSWGMTAR